MDAVMSDIVVELQEGMIAAHKVLAEEAAKRYGLVKVKKLRDEYKASLRNGEKLDVSYEAHEAMAWMMQHEEEILNLVIRAMVKLCRRASESNHTMVTFDDYLQEARLAVYDCMYLYTDASKFLTFSVWCAKKRLIDLARVAQRQKRLLSSLEEAEVEQTLTSSVKDEDIEGMWSAYQHAPLTEMERELVEAYIRGEADYRTKKTQEINPRTGRPWTKQWLSQVFAQACEKIRKCYNKENERRAA